MNRMPSSGFLSRARSAGRLFLLYGLLLPAGTLGAVVALASVSSVPVQTAVFYASIPLGAKTYLTVDSVNDRVSNVEARIENEGPRKYLARDDAPPRRTHHVYETLAYTSCGFLLCWVTIVSPAIP